MRRSFASLQPNALYKEGLDIAPIRSASPANGAPFFDRMIRPDHDVPSPVGRLYRRISMEKAVYSTLSAVYPAARMISSRLTSTARKTLGQL